MISSSLYSHVPSIPRIIFNAAIIVKLLLAHDKSTDGNVTGKSLGKIAKQGTIILLTVTCVFLVLTLPSSIYYQVSENVLSNAPVFYTLYFLRDTDHAINALLYIFSGSQ